MAKYIDADTVVGLMMFDDWGRTVETDTIENILDNFTEEGCPEPADVVPVEELKAEIYKLKHQSEQSFVNHDYYVGYISALSTVEGILAVMDREE